MAAPVRPQKAAAQKQAAPKEPSPPPAPPKDAKKRGPMVPAIIVAVALLGAAFMLKGGGGETPAAAPAAAPAETAAGEGTAEAAAEGVHGDPSHVVSLDAITLNLADGRFLKLGLALQLEEGVEVEDIAGFGARALDTTIDLMGHYTYAELSKEGARGEAKEKLSEAVAEAYDGSVLAVYFTEFVMQ